MSSAPSTKSEKTGEGVRLSLAGDWTVYAGQLAETQADSLVPAADGATSATIDLGGVEQLDTAGAWLIDRSRAQLVEAGIKVDYARAQPEYKILLEEAHYRDFKAPPRPHVAPLILLLSDIGESVYTAGSDLIDGLGFLGQLVTTIVWLAVRPSRWRVTSMVFHLEAFGFRSVPIIVLINFLVGAIVAQQGIFQLQRFGAAPFAVNLIGILVLRELGVLLTSIMIAGRSGSAITAEIGSMKMREEIDALKVMALDPIEVLIVPRVAALLVAMPLLTFLADLAALLGGLCVSWAYGGISPEVYLERLQGAIDFSIFMIGITKAPFMALVIGLIASVEGFEVQGSAESLGRHVTNSVVKSIFMVIVVDGLFAMFFATIRS
ncbi:MlaE family lipid ABC transporter permease subunit [Methylocapsa sp. S129]|uniref:ABC transporter permease n=1 Tax=Methylocapsa sp. S129 TaxID=1641869 RepID=UPI00131A8FC2|nr:MlaE family lipid ABC transporter permease subunit [Methylocapsa sp. S129]